MLRLITLLLRLTLTVHLLHKIYFSVIVCSSEAGVFPTLWIEAILGGTPREAAGLRPALGGIRDTSRQWNTAAPSYWPNTLGPRQNRRHFADNIEIQFFLCQNCFISIQISLKFSLSGLIYKYDYFK